MIDLFFPLSLFLRKIRSKDNKETAWFRSGVVDLILLFFFFFFSFCSFENFILSFLSFSLSRSLEVCFIVFASRVTNREKIKTPRRYRRLSGRRRSKSCVDPRGLGPCPSLSCVFFRVIRVHLFWFHSVCRFVEGEKFGKVEETGRKSRNVTLWDALKEGAFSWDDCLSFVDRWIREIVACQVSKIFDFDSEIIVLVYNNFFQSK